MVQLVMTALYKPVDPEEERRKEQEAKDVKDEEMKDAETDKKDKSDGKDEATKKRIQEEERKERERQGKENAGITALMDEGKKLGDTGVNDETRLKLVKALRHVTEGKVSCKC